MRFGPEFLLSHCEDEWRTWLTTARQRLPELRAFQLLEKVSRAFEPKREAPRTGNGSRRTEEIVSLDQ
jgi:hypothetical protein